MSWSSAMESGSNMIYSNDFRGTGEKLDEEVSPRFWVPKHSIVAA